MSNVALIKDEVVFNIIVADMTWASNNISNLNSDTVVDVTSLDVCIGYTYDGKDFYPPIEEG